jgi:hypothetical protein
MTDKRARMDLLPWDCLTTITGYGIEDFVAVARRWWTREIESLPPALPLDLVEGVARVLGFGAEKYVARGWETDAKYHTASSHFASIMRHTFSADDLDAESGLPNAWHAACRYLMLATLHWRGQLIDDRPPRAPVREKQVLVVSKGGVS